MSGKLKDRVDKLSANSSSTKKNISKLKTTVEAAKIATYQETSKVIIAKK